MIKNNINGIFLFDKHSKITSNSALQKVKHIFGANKAGHSGTLDPLATGLLPICFGEATKVSSYLLHSSKTYVVTAKLGETTETGDAEGRTIDTKTISIVNQSDFNKHLDLFLGESFQKPPMFSAVKINGKRLYKYAQKGEIIDRESRKINVYKITLINLTEKDFEIEVKCSKGTYIRVLIEDIAKKMGNYAHVTQLRRTNIELLDNYQMHNLIQISNMSKNELHNCIHPMDIVFKNKLKIKVNTEQSTQFNHGQNIKIENEELIIDEAIIIYNESNQLQGIGMVLGGNIIKPNKVFNLN